MKKVGVDDFILANSIAQLLSKCKTPSWEFSFSKEGLSKVGANSESIQAVITPTIIMPEIELEALAHEIKGVTKIGLPFIRAEIARAKTKWNGLAPPIARGGEDEIIWDADSQKISELVHRIGKMLEKHPDLFVDPATHTAIIVYREKMAFRRIVTGQDAAKLVGKQVLFKKVRSENNYKSPSGYELIPANIMDVLLADLRKHSDLPQLKCFSTTPLVVNGKLINTPGYYPEEKTLYLGEDIEPKFTFGRIDFLLRTFPFKTISDRIMASILAVYSGESKETRTWLMAPRL